MFKKRNILSIILLIISILTIGMIINIGLLPIKYIILLIVGIALFNGLEIFLLNRKNKTLIVLSILLMIITSFANIAVSYYVYNTNKFLKENFNTEKINKKNNSKKETKEDEVYNIYISGRDFDKLSDFNMIVTINKTDKKVLLTSIPRDYYIDVDGYGLKDKLSFILRDTSLETGVNSVANLFDVEIDYYLQIDTSSLVILIDDIGGIDYCSDIAFTTTHSQVINTYNDSTGNKLYVQKGCQHLNGIQTLTVVRERNALPGRDRARQANCQKVILAILNKMKSVDTLANYTTILKDLSESYTTDIPYEFISDLVKDGINNGTNWTIETQAVDGVDGHDLVHLNTMTDWVMYPYEDTVNAAKDKIKEISK